MYYARSDMPRTLPIQMQNGPISIKVERNLKTFYILEHPGYGSTAGLLSVLDGNILEAFKEKEALKLKTKNSFIESHYESSANCLLKITKLNGILTYTITGIVIKTIRFRDLFDFNVKLRTNDPLHNLSTIMKNMDVHQMFNYKYESSQNNMLVPPPSMCRLNFSLDYNLFKENPSLTNQSLMNIRVKWLNNGRRKKLRILLRQFF
jgi:hypothetical protein